MKTKTQKVLSDLMDSIKEYQENQNITNAELTTMIEQVYENTIVNFKKGYIAKGKSLQEHEEYAEFVISLADSHITTILSSYALDPSISSYEPPMQKIKRLKEFYTRILLAGDKKYKKYNEIFSPLFYITYVPSIKDAIQHRTLVLEERQKKNQN